MDETMLGGRYRRVRPLGRGAMGEVWLAEDTLLHRHVAVKSVPSAFTAEPGDLQRVIREARFAAQLNHPNAVAVYDVVVVDERPFVVMEYVAGRSLAEQIAAEAMAAPEVGRIGIAVAEALADAHQIGLVHRDIKPANIMITPRGVPKIADFGIARLADDVDRSITGVTIGTPAYLSPELARGSAADPRSDIWALGVTLYAALDNGRSPFQAEGDNAFTVIARLATNPVPREPARGGALTPTVMRMLAVDPDRRPDAGTVAEMLRTDLAAGRATQPWSLPPYALAPQVGRESPTDRLPPAPPLPVPPVAPLPVPPVAPLPAAHEQATQTPRESLPLFDDWPEDGWDDTRAATTTYGATSTARGGRASRRRRVMAGVALAVVLVAAAVTGIAVWLQRDSGGTPRAGSSGSGVTSGGPSKGTTTSGSVVPTGTPYSGPGGITVRGPAGWTLDTGSGISNVRDYVAPGGKSYRHATYFRIGIGNANPKPDFTVQMQEETDYLTGPTNPYSDLTIVAGPTRLTFLGAPAADYEYTGLLRGAAASDPARHRHVRLRIWTQGGVQREIVLVATETDWARYRGVFDQLTANAQVSQ